MLLTCGHQEEKAGVATELHVARKEADMLRSQLTAAQQAAAATRRGGVEERAAMAILEQERANAERSAADLMAELRETQRELADTRHSLEVSEV
eukprot:2790317-Pyramimonas_sp.AAC.1